VITVDTTKDWVLINRPTRAKVSVWRAGKWVDAGTMTIPAGWKAGPASDAP